MKAPFPYFGGKRTIAETVWSRLGVPKQYIEPFCGSAAILLSATEPASLEVVNDQNGFIANFWRAVKHQPGEVARAGPDSAATSTGRGIQATGKIPHASDAGRGIQATGQIPHAGNATETTMLTSSGRTAWEWLGTLSSRVEHAEDAA